MASITAYRRVFLAVVAITLLNCSRSPAKPVYSCDIDYLRQEIIKNSTEIARNEWNAAYYSDDITCILESDPELSQLERGVVAIASGKSPLAFAILDSVIMGSSDRQELCSAYFLLSLLTLEKSESQRVSDLAIESIMSWNQAREYRDSAFSYGYDLEEGWFYWSAISCSVDNDVEFLDSIDSLLTHTSSACTTLFEIANHASSIGEIEVSHAVLSLAALKDIGCYLIDRARCILETVVMNYDTALIYCNRVTADYPALSDVSDSAMHCRLWLNSAWANYRLHNYRDAADCLDSAESYDLTNEWINICRDSVAVMMK